MSEGQPQPENPEVKDGDVGDDSAEIDEDASNPHLEPDDPNRAPRDPANITDAHPSNQPEED